MRDCWRSNEPSRFELDTAYQRFQERPGSAAPAPRPWAFGALGMLAGFALMWVLADHASQSAAPITREPVAPPAEPATTPPAPPVDTLRGSIEPRDPPRQKQRPPVTKPTPKSPQVLRDTEDLAQAERWLAVGRGREAEPILSGLEKHGATLEIRERAKALDEKSALTK